jgi:hypothetical protein
MGSEVDHVLRAIVLRHQDEGNALSVDEFFTELKKVEDTYRRRSILCIHRLVTFLPF